MERQAAGVIALTVGVLLLGAYFAFGRWGANSPIPGNSGNSRLFTTSLSNAKQIALAFAIYSTDYDDLMPPNIGDMLYVETVLDPYMKNRSLWMSNNPAGARFLANAELSLVPGPEIVSPNKAALLYESRQWRDGRRIIAYADTHAKAVTAFDSSTDLKVDLTQKGKDFVAKARAASTVQPAAGPAAKPLGMPGN